jgi:hypothetical protein
VHGGRVGEWVKRLNIVGSENIGVMRFKEVGFKVAD